MPAPEPTTGQLLPSEVSAKSGFWFGRARNYPIFSYAWYRYRSLSMVIATVLIFAALGATIWLPSSGAKQNPLEVLHALANYLFPILVLILAGPLFAVAVRGRHFRRRVETLAIAGVLLLGIGCSIGSEGVLKAFSQTHAVATSDGTGMTMRSTPKLRLRVAVIPGDSHRRFTMPPEMQAAMNELQEAARERSPLRTFEEHRALLVAELSRSRIPLEQQADILGLHASLAKSVATVKRADGLAEMPTFRQLRALENWQRLLREEAQQANSRAQQQISRWLGYFANGVVMLAVLYMVLWLGGFLDLLAYVRQRDNLKDALQKMALERSQAARVSAESKLSVLAAQVEPHFLFNSLASARSAIATDPDRATHIIDQLANYLRSTIPQMRDDATRNTVTLASQLNSVRSYLALMHERIPRLQYELESDPDLDQALVPPLMLISLIENAIKHGIEPKPGEGHIKVVAHRAEGQLELRVIDDGVGFGGAVSGGGIGLANIQDRLRTHFGAEASLTLKALRTGGVEAILRLPLSFAS
ncbi:MAG: histidine kinase [Pseudomonadota bacterium]